MVNNIQQFVNDSIKELREIIGNIDIKQEKFYDDILKKLYLNENKGKINVVPVRCGFGKSLVIKVFLKELVKKKMKEDEMDGVIVVTDNLKRLKEIRDFPGLEDMCYLMQHENETGEEIIDGFKKQIKKQSQYPILLMTSQKYELLSEKMRNMFYRWKNGIRNLVIFDEKPFFYRVTEIDVKFMSVIKQQIDYMNEGNKKKYLLGEYRIIENKIDDLKEELADGKQQIKWVKGKGIDNSILGNIEVEEIFLNTVKHNLSPDIYLRINKILQLYKKGGLFVNRKNKEVENSRFFCLLESNFEKFDIDKVNYWIFDATAKFDLEYYGNSVFNIQKVDDKKNENLKIFNINENMSKQAIFRKKNIKIEGLNNFIKKNTNNNENFLVLSYSKIINKIKIRENGEKLYFGNTKGYNNFREIKKMFHVGWNRQNDYYYLGIYLLLNPELINNLNSVTDKEANIEICNLLTYKKVKNVNQLLFEKEELNEIMINKIFIDFEQNIYRTKLRDFNNNEQIVLYVFNGKCELKKELYELIEKWHNVKIETISTSEFAETKILSRKNKKESIAQRLVFWWKNYDWKHELHITEILKLVGITRTQFKGAKAENMELREFINKNKGSKKSYYFYYSN